MHWKCNHLNPVLEMNGHPVMGNRSPPLWSIYTRTPLRVCEDGGNEKASIRRPSVVLERVSELWLVTPRSDLMAALAQCVFTDGLHRVFYSQCSCLKSKQTSVLPMTAVLSIEREQGPSPLLTTNKALMFSCCWVAGAALWLVTPAQIPKDPLDD